MGWNGSKSGSKVGFWAQKWVKMRQNPLLRPLKTHFGIFTKTHFLPSLRGVEIVFKNGPDAVPTQHNDIILVTPSKQAQHIQDVQSQCVISQNEFQPKIYCRADLKVTDLRWWSPINSFLWSSPKIFGFLRKSAVFCGSCALQMLEFPGEGVNLRKSVVFCEISVLGSLSLSVTLVPSP